jgi:hypothetical protein
MKTTKILLLLLLCASLANALEIIDIQYSRVLVEKPERHELDHSYFNRRGQQEIKGKNNAIFLSPVHFIDTNSFELKAVSIPDNIKIDDCLFRPPYSNGIIPVTSPFTAMYLYDLNKKVYIKEAPEYMALYQDGDKIYLSALVFTYEYTAFRISASQFILITENDEIFLGTEAINNFVRHNNSALSEEYFIETFININSTGQDLITSIDFFHGAQESDMNGDLNCHTFISKMKNDYVSNAKYYLLRRLEEYFEEDLYGKIKNDYFEINLFSDGFYIYSKESIIILDIRNKQTVQYNFDEEVKNKINDNSQWYFGVFISTNADYFYVLSQRRNNDFKYELFEYKILKK